MNRLALLSHLIVLCLAIVWLDGCSRDPIQSSVNWGTISGTARHSVTGKPITGVTVTCAGLSVDVDDNGYYFINNVPRGYHELQALKDGFDPYEADLLISTGTAHDIDMDESGFYASVSGFVYLGQSSVTLSEFLVVCGSRVAISDDSGYYFIDSVATGKHPIRGIRTNYLRYEDSLSLQEDIRYDIHIAATELTGQVTNVVDGPLESCLVLIGPVRAETDANGRFHLPVAPQGLHTIYGVHADYHTTSADIRLDHEPQTANLSMKRTVFDTLGILEDATVVAADFESCTYCPDWGDSENNFGYENRLRLEYTMAADPLGSDDPRTGRSRFLLRLADLPGDVGFGKLDAASLVLYPTGDRHNPGVVTVRQVAAGSEWSEGEVSWLSMPTAYRIPLATRTITDGSPWTIDVYQLYRLNGPEGVSLMFQKDEAGPTDGIEFVEFWSGESPHSSIRPQVRIQYTR